MINYQSEVVPHGRQLGQLTCMLEEIPLHHWRARRRHQNFGLNKPYIKQKQIGLLREPKKSTLCHVNIKQAMGLKSHASIKLALLKTGLIFGFILATFNGQLQGEVKFRGTQKSGPNLFRQKRGSSLALEVDGRANTVQMFTTSTTNSPTLPANQLQILQMLPNALDEIRTTQPKNGTQIAPAEPQMPQPIECTNGLLTFELSTGFIYKPTNTLETLAMMPSTLQLTDCLDHCLQNSSCLAINFEMGLCVLLATSAQHSPQSLYSSQFPVFTIYAEKKCLLSGK